MEGLLDVAVVGGGVSGVYSAWRIKENDQSKNVALFELSHRIGGRLLTVTPPGMPHVRCELGGMRYMSNQTLVRSLVEDELKLSYHQFPVSVPTNIAYLRGVYLRMNELEDSAKAPYNLAWSEQGKNPGSLIGDAVEQVVPGISKLSGQEREELLRTFKFEGQNLYDWGFWNLIMKSMSSEAYDLATKSMGYNTAAWNWNAMDTIPSFFGDFGTDVEYRAIDEGFEQVPLQLAQKFEDLGGTLHTRHRLAAFDVERNEAGDVSHAVLHFQVLDDDDNVTDTVTIRARQLILAMPRRSLELIDQTGAMLGGGHNDDMHRWIRSITPNPLFKIFVCYHTPWWEAAGVKQGESVTDLPIRQCYYWGTEGDQWGADTSNRNSVLLATYSDGDDVQFWAGLRGHPDKEARLFFQDKYNHFADKHADDIDPRWRDYRAPRHMVEEIHAEVTELHDLRYAPRPYSAVYKDWGEDPYGGGVNFWNVHEKSWEMIPHMLNPLPELPIYICGEAYSGTQGWVEGALQTAEAMLEKYFGLPDPPWVSYQ
jgi:monoamine oxidase